jgi:hypothetical protein
MRISEIIVSEGRAEMKFQLRMCGVWIDDIESRVNSIIEEYTLNITSASLSDAKNEIAKAKADILVAVQLPVLDQSDDLAARNVIRHYISLYERLMKITL